MTTIEREVKDLKERVAQLESYIFQQKQPRIPFLSPGKAMRQEQLRSWLEAKGFVARLPPAAQTQAERWRKMMGDEKQEHVRSMRSLKLDPPLSQIVIENRR